MIVLHDSEHASTDASDLGLAPGDFPKKLSVDVPGRGQTSFVRCGQIFSRRELAGFEYEAPDGFSLVIYND